MPTHEMFIRGPTDLPVTHDITWQFPPFTMRRFLPKRAAYCLCVFVLNEDPRIQRQIQRMKPFSGLVDIIIVDGGSTDGALKPPLLSKNRMCSMLVKRGEGQLSAQMRMAFAWALATGYRGVITMDGNDKDDPSAIPHFVRALDLGYDHVQGSRFIPGGRAINTPWWRYWAIRLIHAPLMSVAARHHYTDTTNGFRAYSSRLLMDARVSVFRDIFSRYELHYYLAMQAAQRGYRIKEIPVTRRYPNEGNVPSKISLLTGSMLIAVTLLKAVLHRWDLSSVKRGVSRCG